MFQIEVFFNTLEVTLENNKNFPVQINSNPKNCVGWTIAFLSGPLSSKEVIGSTKVNLGDFLRPNIYRKIPDISPGLILFQRHFFGGS